MSFRFTEFFRFVFASTLFSVNLSNLFHLQLRRNVQTCVHSYSFGLTVFLTNIYLCMWIPYLFSSFYHNTPWPLLELNIHCSIQHLVIIQVSTLILAILSFQSLFEAFSVKRAKMIGAIIFIAWIFPQTIHFVLSELTSLKDASNVYFLNGFNDKKFPLIEDNFLNRGLLLCVHKLDSSVISHMTWHYVVLVVPLTSMFIICTGAKKFAKTSVLGNYLNCLFVDLSHFPVNTPFTFFLVKL